MGAPNKNVHSTTTFDNCSPPKTCKMMVGSVDRNLADGSVTQAATIVIVETFHLEPSS